MSFGAFGSNSSAPSTFTAFGQNNQQQNKPLSAFGQPSQPSAFSAFSTSQQQNSLSGQQQPGQAQSSSLFGGSAFGSNPAQIPGFGTTSTATNTATTSPFGTFGSSQTQPNTQQSQQPTPGTSSFGGSSLAPPNGSTTPGSGSSLFGSLGQPVNQNQIQQNNPFPKFDSALGSSTTLAQPQTQSFGSIFGNPSSSSVPSNAFSGQNSVAGLSYSNIPQAGPQNTSVEGQISALYDSWNHQSPQCRFQHYFYNLVDPADVAKYTRPTTATNEALWHKALRENPNPTRLVPVLAIGFDDLKKRVQAQKAQTEAQLAGMQILKKEIEKMSENHTLKVQPRVSELSHTQTELTNRLAKLIHHLHLFLPSVRSTSIRPDEEVLRGQLDGIEAELRRPGGLGRVGGRIGELWGVLSRVRAQREGGRQGYDREGGWAVVDGAAFEEIKHILSEEQQGLKYLTEMLRTALHDVNLIRTGMGNVDLSASRV